MENAGKELEDAELKASLKDAGIGTPATRAAIIETLFARQYIVREKKNLVPTDKGLAVYKIVRGQEDCRCRNDGYVGNRPFQDRSGKHGCRHVPKGYRGVRRPNHGGTAIGTIICCGR